MQPRMPLALALAVQLLVLGQILSWTTLMTFATPVATADIDERAPVPTAEALSLHRQFRRTEFPDTPVSCKFCELHFNEIDSCANASVVFSNVAAILWNPKDFISVINCACTDTFKSTYPQCVDCFEQTNQTVFLEPSGGNLSSIVVGMRQICALGSAIFGGVASANSQLPGQTPVPAPTSGALRRAFIIARSGDGGILLLTALSTVLLGLTTGVWTAL